MGQTLRPCPGVVRSSRLVCSNFVFKFLFFRIMSYSVSSPSEGVRKLKLRNLFLGFTVLTLLAACSGEEPQPAQPQPATDQNNDEDFPDLILPENE